MYHKTPFYLFKFKNLITVNDKKNSPKTVSKSNAYKNNSSQMHIKTIQTWMCEFWRIWLTFVWIFLFFCTLFFSHIFNVAQWSMIMNYYYDRDFNLLYKNFCYRTQKNAIKTKGGQFLTRSLMHMFMCRNKLYKSGSIAKYWN